MGEGRCRGDRVQAWARVWAVSSGDRGPLWPLAPTGGSGTSSAADTPATACPREPGPPGPRGDRPPVGSSLSREPVTWPWGVRGLAPVLLAAFCTQSLPSRRRCRAAATPDAPVAGSPAGGGNGPPSWAALLFAAGPVHREAVRRCAGRRPRCGHWGGGGGPGEGSPEGGAPLRAPRSSGRVQRGLLSVSEQAEVCTRSCSAPVLRA